MRIYTSRYTNREAIAASGALPVRMSVGFPDFPLGYDVPASLLDAAPDPFMLSERDAERFEGLYLAKLERVGVERLRRLLAAICDAFAADALVLLCWERVTNGGACHRRLFANWWQRATGEVVEELPDPARVEDSRQLGLPLGGSHGAA